MHVFSRRELGPRFDLERAISFGLVPPHYLGVQPEEALGAYVDRYLTEEVAAEGLTRKLPAFEHVIFLELRTWIDYRLPRTPLAYWRSTSGFEVDFVLGDRIAIEVKAARRVDDRDLRGLRALRDEGRLQRYLLVCREERPRRVDGIDILPWELFLDQLWAGRILE